MKAASSAQLRLTLYSSLLRSSHQPRPFELVRTPVEKGANVNQDMMFPERKKAREEDEEDEEDEEEEEEGWGVEEGETWSEATANCL